MRPKSFVPALAVAVCLASVSELHALANRVFVSARSGNDANTCDNILTPCQTFAGAVAQLNPGGEAIVLDSGGYGAVTITQPLTIEAPPGVTAFIHPSSGEGIVVNAGSNDTVVLRGLTINGGGHNGIQINIIGVLVVENCVIKGVANDGIFVGSPAKLDMKNTDISGCAIAVDVFHSSGTSVLSIDHCHLNGNLAGFRAGTTSPGASKTAATNSTANNNSQIGWICGAGATGTDVLVLESSSASGNGTSGALNNSSNASSVLSYSNCEFSNNGNYGVDRENAGPVQSRSSSTITGNGSAPTNGTITTFGPL